MVSNDYGKHAKAVLLVINGCILYLYPGALLECLILYYTCPVYTVGRVFVFTLTS